MSGWSWVYMLAGLVALYRGELVL